ncbi:MAG: serine/threonine-protein kinase [Acidimicrobiales bacterium]
MSPATSAPLIGAVLADRYEVVRHIASGGMGDVFEAHDRVLERTVAVKLYRASAPADRSRFRSEVTTLASLNHPNLVHVFDAGEHDEGGFLVLELVEGPTLRETLAERSTLPSQEVAELGTALASALASVHERGVVHRDVTPSNVLCGRDGRPRLTDFGIARLLDTSRVTATAATIGTAAYMAPEQVEGRDVTPAADVYALGLVLLEALTGRLEYPGAASEAALARLTRPPDATTGVPPEWRPVLAAMTAREPDRRPDACDVAERLSAGSVAAGPPSAVPAGAAVAVGVRPAGHEVSTVDAAADTELLAVRGGTAVMPALVAPVATRASGPLGRRALWVAAAVIGLVVLIALAVSGSDPQDTTPNTTEPAAAPSTTIATTTTVPPPTSPPAAAVGGDEGGDGGDGEGQGSRNGEGKKKGGGKD